MPCPSDAPASCPPGLEYLTQVDQVLVNQQIELLECKFYLRATAYQGLAFYTQAQWRAWYACVHFYAQWLFIKWIPDDGGQ